MTNYPSRTLATFAAQLGFDDIPQPIVEQTLSLYVDWLGSALGGKGARPVESIALFASIAGATNGNGPSEVLIDHTRATPYFAAMVNAAASHFVEQDDVHNGSVFHPATVVFPVVLALSQATRASGRDFIAAVVAGYEVGIRIGESLGRSHYKVFHTTGTAGTVAAAAAAGRMLGLSPGQMLDAFGSTDTQASGLWEFLRDAADSKQLHTAMAGANGLMAACGGRLQGRHAHS
jgi:2-methylcitrate dehydratase PrpD